MSKDKNIVNTKITPKHLRIAMGLFICLVSIFCVLNFGYVSGFIFWCVSFFVGSFFAYISYILLFLFGLKFIFQKKFAVRNLNLLIIGCVIISLGVLTITTNQISALDGTYLTFSNFRSVYIKSLNLNEFPKLRIDQSGGIIGYTLVAILNSCFTQIGTTVFSSVLISAGTILVLARPIVYLVHSIKADKKEVSENAKAFNEFTEENNLLDTSSSLTRDGTKDYTEDDELTNGPTVISKIPDAEPEPVTPFTEEDIKEDDLSPLITPITVVESTLPDEIFEDAKPEEPTIAPEPVPEAHVEEEIKHVTEPDEENLMPNMANDREFDFAGGGLQRVRFTPTAAELGRSEDTLTPISESKSQVSQQNFDHYESRPVSVEPTYANNVEESHNDEYISEAEEIEERYIEDSVVEEPVIDNQNEESKETLASLDDQVQEQIRQQEALNRELHGRVEQPKPAPKPVASSSEETVQEGPFKKIKNKIKYVTTPVDLLDESKSNEETESKNIKVCEERTEIINQLLADFKIGAKVISYKIGPSVTRYDVETQRNYSVQGIDKYMNDISVRLGGTEARFVPIIQGKTTSGIEIANEQRAVVAFKDVYEHLPRVKQGKLEIPFGVNISGDYISADLANFPHMLVCGTTGSGKSIYMHSVILSLIMRNSMEDLRLIMIDPKCVEFKKYEAIPHLLCPIITEANEANATLLRLVDEMEERFRIFSDAGVSDVKQYNEICVEKGYQKLPFIVVIVDEFADLIDTNKQIAQPVSRLGAKARAAGIHMIIATQRPSTDVITGTIKSNLAVRVALMTSSTTDSVVVLSESGAEKLLGNGDMLVSCPLVSKQEKTRVQGCFVSNSEIIRVVNYIKEKYPLVYDDRFVNLLEKSRLEATDLGTIHASNGEDNAYEMVKEHIMREKDTCSISYISNTFHFGFRRSQEIFNKLLAEHVLEKPEYANSAKGAKVMVHLAGYKDPNAEPETPGTYSQSTFEAK